MRIGIITETFLPKVDGIANTLCHVLTHLAARPEHSALMLAPAGAPDHFANTRVIGLPAAHFPFYPELKLASPFANIGAHFDAYKPDVIHVVNPVSLGIAGLRYARRNNIPVVASYQTDIPGFVTRWGYGFLSKPLYAYLRWIHSQADLNIAPSRATRDELAAHGFKHLNIWGRGVDCARFNPSRRSDEWRARLTAGHPSAPLLMFTGRVAREKRIDWLRAVLDAIPQARLAIIGDGPARPELEQLFNDGRAVFTGFLGGVDLACAYAAADVFVFPSANETFGNVLLEAMASGLPVVAAASGGPLDVVQHGRTGLFFAPEDKRAMTAAVQNLLTDSGLARQLSLNARAEATGRSWEARIGELLAFYESAITAACARQDALRTPASPMRGFKRVASAE